MEPWGGFGKWFGLSESGRPVNGDVGAGSRVTSVLPELCKGCRRLGLWLAGSPVLVEFGNPKPPFQSQTRNGLRTPSPDSHPMPRPPLRRSGSGRDGYGSSLLLPRGRDGQMPTWQRLGLAHLPRRPGQGPCPREHWSLGPPQRVRWPEAE